MAPDKCTRYLIQGLSSLRYVQKIHIQEIVRGDVKICSEDTYAARRYLHPELDVCSMKTRYLLNNSRQSVGVGIKGQT